MMVEFKKFSSDTRVIERYKMNIELTPEIISILVLIGSSLFVLIVFGVWSMVLYKKSDKYSRVMPVHHSKGIINIKEKKVIIKEISKVRVGEVHEYDLEDFIYMISINPASKDFRELLKMINSGATSKKIHTKMISTPKVFLFIIDYNDKRRTLSMVNINPFEETENEIHFQMQNNELVSNTRKSHIDMEFLEENLMPSTDSEIFNNLVKTSRKFLSKGVTIIKISPKHSFIEAGKDYLLNLIQFTTLKRELAKQNVHCHLGRDGSLYSIVANDRKKNFLVVQKTWEAKIASMFPKVKRFEYVDLDIGDLNIDTFIIPNKDSKSISEALIYVNLVSEHKRKKIDIDVDELIFEAKAINISADEILKALKEKKPPIRKNENPVIERGIKSIYEVYIDYPKEILDPIIKYSFRHKKEILDILIKQANKEATRSKTQNIAITIDVFSIPEIIKIIESETFKPNVHIVFQERERVRHYQEQLEESVKILKDKNIKTIQLVHDEKGGNIKMYRLFKPEYIMIAKGLNSALTLSDSLKINLNTLENIKDKETKIINLK